MGDKPRSSPGKNLQLLQKSVNPDAQTRRTHGLQLPPAKANNTLVVTQNNAIHGVGSARAFLNVPHDAPQGSSAKGSTDPHRSLKRSTNREPHTNQGTPSVRFSDSVECGAASSGRPEEPACSSKTTDSPENASKKNTNRGINLTGEQVQAGRTSESKVADPQSTVELMQPASMHDSDEWLTSNGQRVNSSPPVPIVARTITKSRDRRRSPTPQATESEVPGEEEICVRIVSIHK